MQTHQNRSLAYHALGWAQVFITSTAFTGYTTLLLRKVVVMLSWWSPAAIDAHISDFFYRDRWGGTFGTLAAALVAWWMLAQGLPSLVPFVVGVIAFFVGLWACAGGEAYTVERWGPGKKHGKSGAQTTDLSATNIDEFAPFLAGVSPIFLWQCSYEGQLAGLAVAFEAFRILDGATPRFVKVFEDEHEGTAWGVMIDDPVAMLPVTLVLCVVAVFLTGF